MQNVGILINKNCKLNFETYNSIKYLQQNKNINIIYIIQIAGKGLDRKDRIRIYLRKGLPWFLSRLVAKTIYSAESKLLSFNYKFKKLNTQYNLKDLKKNKLKFVDLEVIVSPSGNVTTIKKKDFSLIRSLKLNLILNFGGGIWKGEILKSSKMGILSMHHGDNRINRGGPPCFWEVLKRIDNTGFIIQILTEQLDGGKIISRGSVTTNRTWASNYASCRHAAYREWERQIDSILSGGKLNFLNEICIYSNRLFQAPNILDLISYISKTIFILIKKIIKKLFEKPRKFYVSIINVKDWSCAELRKGVTLKSPQNRSYADPNLFNYQNKKFLLVEDYSDKNGKGDIRLFEFNLLSKKFKDLGIIIKEKHHVSFPFYFEYENNHFISVESAQDGCVSIYKLQEEITKWKLEKKIFIDSLKEPIDPIIFYFDNLWWLIVSEGYCDLNNEMYIFYSENPINSKWEEHSKNPIYINQYSRNGGFIKKGDKHYRVSQISGFDNYGKKICLREINLLTKNNFNEKSIQSIHSGFSSSAKGVHTFTAIDELTAFDYWKET